MKARNQFDLAAILCLFFFVALFILSVPFPRRLIPDPGLLLNSFFEWIEYPFFKILGFHHSRAFEFESDSFPLLFHIGFLSVFSILIGVAISVFFSSKINLKKWEYYFHLLIRYYLSLQLFVYGFDKVFKTQFYLPEPNLLYTPMGMLHKDILYWSTIGVSWPYSVFGGVMEIVPALLLLFYRTRIAGALIATGVLANVVAINFSYDISVKLYSSFLLLLSVILCFNFLSNEIRKLFTNPSFLSVSWRPDFSRWPGSLSYFTLKGLFTAVLFAECLYPYMVNGNFNDDLAGRPALHGVWQVETESLNGKPLLCSSDHPTFFKRIFFHRLGYLITENGNDIFQDYPFFAKTADSNLDLQNPDKTRFLLHYEFSLADSGLLLSGLWENEAFVWKGKNCGWKELPLLRSDFRLWE